MKNFLRNTLPTFEVICYSFIFHQTFLNIKCIISRNNLPTIVILSVIQICSFLIQNHINKQYNKIFLLSNAV